MPVDRSRIEVTQIIQENPEGPSINDDMMHSEQKNMIILCSAEESQSANRALLKIKDTSMCASHLRTQPIKGPLGRIYKLQGGFGGVPHLLVRFSILFTKRGPQSRMSLLKQLKCLLQHFDIHSGTNANRKPYVIDRTIWLEAMLKPQGLLVDGQGKP